MVKNSVFGGQKRTILGSFPMGYTGNGHFDTPFWDLIFSDRVLRGASPKVTINQLKIDPLFSPLKKGSQKPVFLEIRVFEGFFQRLKKGVNFQLIYSNFWRGASQNRIRNIVSQIGVPKTGIWAIWGVFWS
jgi:hypothetical protein